MTIASSGTWIWPLLGKRLPTVKTTLGLLLSRPSVNILELGTTRSFRQGVIDTIHFNPDPTTWDWGAGCFTFACLSLLPAARITSVDISSEALKVCKKLCAEHESRLTVEETDSSSFLMKTSESYDLIYMDHAEADGSDQVALLHLHDAKIIISRSLLKPEGMILIDDVGVPQGQFSKGLYSIPFLTSIGFTELSHRAYQALLRRDWPPGG